MIACFIALMAAMNTFQASAQARLVTVTGTVTDENGDPLPGASVIVEETGAGVVTDIEGKYKVKACSNQNLVFSFIGFKNQSYVARSNRTLNVALQPDTKLLDEVVVVGYGTMKRSDLTGSVSSVSAKALENFKAASVAGALGGMVAGVNVTTIDGAPGSGFDIKIRGVGTVNGDSSPLYIVDGFEVSDIDYLATQDIKSIEVLKDASACAIYGARAANGVVLVTTKSGHVGKPEISYNGSASYRLLSKRLDVLTPYEFVDLQMEVNPTRYEGLYYRSGSDANGTPYRFQTLDDYIGVKGVDWQEEAFRPTWSQNHEFSIRGGDKQTQYLASFSHYDEDGIFANSGHKKTTARLKFNRQIFKWMSFSTTVDYTNTVTTGVGTGGGMLSGILMYRPTGGVLTSDYELRYNSVDPLLDILGTTSDYSYNPIINAEKTVKNNSQDRWNAYANLNIQIGKYFSFRTSGNFGLQTSRVNTFYQNGTSSADRGGGPYGDSKTRRYMRYGVTNQLTYNQLFQKNHKVNVTVGQEVTYEMDEDLYGQAKDFPLDDLGTDNLGLGAVPASVTSSKKDKTRLSFFGRAFYSYADKYLLTATVRADASSVFASKYKWGLFPSFAFAWNMSNEKWLKDVESISNMKLRAGWGMVGNDRITNYLSLALYSNLKYGQGSKQITVLNPCQIANPELRWEASMTTNLGVDMGFFKNRLNVTVDAFLKDSHDLLLAQDLALASGFETQWQNVGKVRNKGIEITINSINVNNANFSWSTDFNISFVKNTLVSLQSGKDYMLSKTSITSAFKAYDYISKVGDSLGSMYGYVFDGVYQTSDFVMDHSGKMRLKPGIPDISQHSGVDVAPGFVKYKDIDGDGVITTDDRTVIGNGQPLFFGGMTNSLYIYGVDLSFMFQYSYGNDVYNAQRMVGNQTDLERSNMMGEVRNRWKPTNASNTVPSAKGIIRGDVTSRFIEDGSFLRLKNLTIGYTLPHRVVRNIYVTKLRVYATAENLFLLTKYSGFDPEVSVDRTNLRPGLDWGAYPKSKVFTVGVELNF